MKAKLIYATLISLFVGSEISNASEKTNENIDFTNAPKQEVKIIHALSPTDHVKIEGKISYLSQDTSALPQFIEYINCCVKQYKPEMKLNAEKEIVILAEDSINMTIFARYALQNLFSYLGSEHTVTPAFKEFVTQQKSPPFKYFTYAQNCVLFSLMFCFDASSSAKPLESVEIENRFYSYNNVKFSFLPCPAEQKDKGRRIENFSFDAKDLPHNSPAKLHPSTTDTIARSLSDISFPYDAIYQITPFKIDDDLFRLHVKLSSKESRSSLFLMHEEYQVRKDADLLLRVSKK